MRQNSLWVVLALVAVAGCSKGGSSTSPPPPPPEHGRIEVLSAPSGAAILLDGTATGSVTPDTLEEMGTGSHTVALHLSSYADSAATVTVTANSLTRVSIALRHVQLYTPPAIAFDHRTFTIPGFVHSLTTGDFNADGRVDLAAVSVTDRQVIRILTGAGDGTFSLGGIVLDTTATIWGLQSGDFNQDGRADLVGLLEVARQGRLVTWLGNGDGTFTRAGTAVWSYQPIYTPMFVGDVSGDGVSDVCLGYLAGSNVLGLGIWLGNGDGTLQPFTEYTKIFGVELSEPTGFALGDFDRDGRLDLAQGIYGFGSGKGGFALWRGTGGGHFGASDFVSSFGYCQDLEAADFNQDGKLDLATSNTGGGAAQGSVQLLLGHGDGTFANPVAFPTALYTTGLEVDDFNRDGRVDVVTVDAFSNASSALAGTGDGWFAAPQAFGLSTSPGPMLRADVNGDGKMDLLILATPYPEASPSTVDVLLGL